MSLDSFKDLLAKSSIKANDFQVQLSIASLNHISQAERLFDKIDIAKKGHISWDDICTFIMQREQTRDKRLAKERAVEFKPLTKTHQLVHKDRVTKVIPFDTRSGFIIGSNVSLSFL